MSFIIPSPFGEDSEQNARGQQPNTRNFAWWIPIFVGVVLILAGAGLVLWPFFAAQWMLVLLFGTALIANGLGMLVRSRGSSAGAIGGILLILTGVLSLVFADFTVTALVTFVGVTLLCIGVGLLLLTAKFVQGTRTSVLFPPIIMIVAGIITLVWPEFSIQVVAVVCGLLTILFGVFIIWASQRFRRGSATHETIIVD